MGNNCNIGRNWGWIIIILIIVVFASGNNGSFWGMNDNCGCNMDCGC